MNIGFGVGINAGASGGTGSGDPNFASVGLLLHFDGTNGQTTTVDSSASPKTVTLSGTAQLDTATKQFGSSSLKTAGNTDFATIAYSAANDFGTGLFTIEGWIKTSDATVNGILFCTGTSAVLGSYIIVINAITNGSIAVYQNSNNTNWTNVVFTGGININNGAWHHIAFVRSSPTALTTYVDGVSQGTSVIGSADKYGVASTDILMNQQNGGTTGIACNYDEWRLTKGVARYLGNFTPSATAFPSS